jgi:periplasmic protein TonB
MEVLGPGETRPGGSTPLSAPQHTAPALAAALALHAALIVAFLHWSFSQAALTPPESIAVEVVVEASPPASVKTAGAPAAEPPPAQATEAEPPPLDQIPPPPPVAENPPPAPRAAAETPPKAVEPPANKTPPPPVAENLPPAPPAAAEASRPKANVRPPVVRTPSSPPPPKRVPVPAKPAPSAKAAPKPAATAAEPVSIVRSKPAASQASNANGARSVASGAPTSAVPRAAPSSADSAAYQGAVLAAIAAHKHYPEAALGRAARGVAVVTFTIGGAGQVVSAQLSRSAGDATLDADAVATVRRTSPFPPPPAGAPRRFAATLNYIPR